MEQLILQMFQTSHLPTHIVENVKVTGVTEKEIAQKSILSFMVSLFLAPISYQNKTYKFGLYRSVCDINIINTTAYITVDGEMLEIYDYRFTEMFQSWLNDNDPYVNLSYIMRENDKARLNYYIYSYSDLYNRTTAKYLYNYFMNL